MRHHLLTPPVTGDDDWLEPLAVEAPPPPPALRERPPNEADLAEWAARLVDRPPPTRAYAPRFLRLLDVSPVELPGALHRWWHAAARDDIAVLARVLRVGPPRGDRRETWTMTGRLRVANRPPIAVDVMLWPHLGYWTKLTMEPHAPTRVGRSYFRRGHAALDELRDALVR